MGRHITQLLAQPLLFLLLYCGGSLFVTMSSLVLTFGVGTIITAALLSGSYVLVTRVIPVPRPDQPVNMTRHESADDVIFKNNARLALPAVIPGITVLPFLFLPLSVYEPIGFALIGLLLIGAYAAEAWAVYRLTAQYLPEYAPHLCGDNYEPPLN